MEWTYRYVLFGFLRGGGMSNAILGSSSRRPLAIALFATAAMVLAVMAAFAVVRTAGATHGTSVTLEPAQVEVLSGGTASFTGNVNATIEGDASCNYGWELSASGGPAGSTYTLAPEVSDGAKNTAYTLDVEVPADATAGLYEVTLTTDWIDACSRSAGADTIKRANILVILTPPDANKTNAGYNEGTDTAT